MTKKIPPHIHSTDSLPRRFWGQTVALLPLFVAACLAGHAEILRVLLISLVSAVAFEFLATKLLQKKENLKSGETILAAALFSLLLPSRCPSELVILGVFIAIVVGKEFFGGTGAYPLPPLLLARAILQISFPNAMAEPMLLTGASDLWPLAGTGLGAILLLNQRKGYWETPVLFTAACLICQGLCVGCEISPVFLSSILFTAFFLLADPVVLPLTRRGSAYFALVAALLSFLLGRGVFSVGVATFALLWMGLAAPWLDIGLKPVPYKSKRSLKATYSP